MLPLRSLCDGMPPEGAAAAACCSALQCAGCSMQHCSPTCRTALQVCINLGQLLPAPCAPPPLWRPGHVQAAWPRRCPIAASPSQPHWCLLPSIAPASERASALPLPQVLARALVRTALVLHAFAVRFLYCRCSAPRRGLPERATPICLLRTGAPFAPAFPPKHWLPLPGTCPRRRHQGLVAPHNPNRRDGRAAASLARPQPALVPGFGELPAVLQLHVQLHSRVPPGEGGLVEGGLPRAAAAGRRTRPAARCPLPASRPPHWPPFPAPPLLPSPTAGGRHAVPRHFL